MPRPAYDIAAPAIDQVLGDPAASNWLKTSLLTALQRDAVDAVADATMLLQLLEDRANALLGFGAAARG